MPIVTDAAAAKSQLDQMGVPVFLADIKGDLSGMATAGFVALWMVLAGFLDPSTET